MRAMVRHQISALQRGRFAAALGRALKGEPRREADAELFAVQESGVRPPQRHGVGVSVVRDDEEALHLLDRRVEHGADDRAPAAARARARRRAGPGRARVREPGAAGCAPRRAARCASARRWRSPCGCAHKHRGAPSTLPRGGLRARPRRGGRPPPWPCRGIGGRARHPPAPDRRCPCSRGGAFRRAP